MLKELGCYMDAELCYRDALALGAPPSDVMQHLAFTADRGGCSSAVYDEEVIEALEHDEVIDGVGSAAFALRLVVSDDVTAMYGLCFEEADVSAAIRLAAMRRTPRFDDFLAETIANPRFARENPRLVERAAEMGL